MSEIAMYNGTPSSFDDAYKLAKIFADSGMFEGAKGLAQAMVKVQAGAELGITPYAAMSGIHIIAGKPVLGAGLIAAKIRQSGVYDYEVKERNDQRCTIAIVQVRGAQRVLLGTETFTIEQAKKAGVKNLDKFPGNMLFARAISNAAKFYCPDIFNGSVYVPEDFPEQTTVDVPATVVESNVAKPSHDNTQTPPTNDVKVMKPESIPARPAPHTAKQAATYKSLLASPLFTDKERAEYAPKIMNADKAKADELILRVSKELERRQQAASAETAAQAKKIDTYDPAAEDDRSAETDDDLPDWVKN